MNTYKQSIVSSGMLPHGRPHAYTFQINFAAANPYVIDLTQAEAQRTLANIQTIYVNNQGNDNAVNVNIGGTGQLIIVPPNFIIQCPIFVDSTSASITISSPTSASTIQVILLDIPADAYQFDALGSTSISIPLEVSPTSSAVNSSSNPFFVDVTNLPAPGITEISATTAANSASNPIYVDVTNAPSGITEISATTAANSASNPIYVDVTNAGIVSSAGVTTYFSLSKVFADNVAYAQLSTTVQTALIPHATLSGVVYFIKNIHLSLTTNATLATAGIETITFLDAVEGEVFVYDIYVPATAAAVTPTAINIPLEYIPADFNANSALSVQLGTALATGVLNIIVEYGYII